MKLKHLKIILVIVIATFALTFLIQSNKANKLRDNWKESEGAFKEKDSDYKKLKKTHDKERADIEKERAKEREARERAEAEIVKIKIEGRKKDAELANAKKLIRTLSPDELCFKLNERVPSEFSLLEAGDFRLSRVGAEKTLSIFMDEARWRDTIGERDKEIVKLNGKNKSFENDIFSVEKALATVKTDLKNCDTALKASEKSKKDLKKMLRSVRWKERGKGAVGGALFTIIFLKLFGLIGGK